jgi:ArsR family transcriptional regulator, arsenate/arsenite/antimonite-responsive transcriptional repressor
MRGNVPEGRFTRPKLPLLDGALSCGSVTEVVLSESEALELSGVLAAISDPVRLRLLSIVAANAEVCSCDLEGPLARSQPTISHHTRVLSEAGLIIGEKRGRWVWWRIAPDRLGAVRRALGGS